MKKHNYNLLCLPGSSLNQDGGMQLQELFKNINELICKNFQMWESKVARKSIRESKELMDFEFLDISDMPIETIQSQEVGIKAMKMELYTEQVHVYHNFKLKECIMVCTNNFIYFLSKDGKEELCTKLEIVNDIKQIVKGLRQTNREQFLCLAIELNESCKLRKRGARSHYFIIQHNRSNFERFIDFINYHIYISMKNLEEVKVIKKSMLEKFETTIDKKVYMYNF